MTDVTYDALVQSGIVLKSAVLVHRLEVQSGIVPKSAVLVHRLEVQSGIVPKSALENVIFLSWKSLKKTQPYILQRLLNQIPASAWVQAGCI